MNWRSRASRAYAEPAYADGLRTGQGGPGRRLIAFGVVFVIVSLAGLGYTFLRAAEYRATARAEIVPAEDLEVRAPENGASGAGAEVDVPVSFLGELQVLTSRPLLARLLHQLHTAGLLDFASETQGVSALQSMISVTPIKDTRIVELTAVGSRPDVLAPAVNGLLQQYEAQVLERYRSTSGQAVKEARDQAERYEAAVNEKRQAMSALRARYGIVSLERDENEALSEAKGLGVSLTTAEDKAAAAEARVRALKDSIAAGQSPVLSKDDPTLAGLEERLSQAREQYSQLQRRFTENYLALDPKARALKTSIAELEAQVQKERAAGRQANLAGAQEEAARARQVVDQLHDRLGATRQTAQAFSARFGEYKTLQDELNNLEALLRSAREKAVRLEASERARRPQVRLIEAAVMPLEPWRPLYLRDSCITLGAAVVLGFLAAWLTAFLTQRDEGPAFIVAPTAFPYPVSMNGPAGGHSALEGVPAIGAIARGSVPPMLPPAAAPLELGDAEVVALLQAADPVARAVIVVLLSGLAPEELLPLRWSDVDTVRATVRIGSPSPREFALTPETASALRVAQAVKSGHAAAGGLSEPLVPASAASGLLASDLESLVACAAHDAGLPMAADVTPAVLRHTYLAFMARNGVRFSDLAAIAGPLPASAISFYGALAPGGKRRSLAEIDGVLPGVRQWMSTLTLAGQPDFPPASTST